MTQSGEEKKGRVREVGDRDLQKGRGVQKKSWPEKRQRRLDRTGGRGDGGRERERERERVSERRLEI